LENASENGRQHLSKVMRDFQAISRVGEKRNEAENGKKNLFV
jgi:hypothetical protein